MQVVIVIGQANYNDSDKQRFAKRVRELVKNLVIDFRISRDQFTFIAGQSGEGVFKKLEELFLEKSKEDFCLFYIGHGSNKDGGGWAVRGTNDDILRYSELALAVAHLEGRLILVNDCCYAGLAEEALKFHSSENLLIASSPGDRVSIYGIAENLLWSWKNGRKYEPKAFVSPSHKDEIFELHDNVLKNPASPLEGEFFELRFGSDLDHLMIACGAR